MKRRASRVLQCRLMSRSDVTPKLKTPPRRGSSVHRGERWSDEAQTAGRAPAALAFLCFLAVFLAGASFFISLAAGAAAGAGAAAAAGAEAWAKAPIETVAAISAARI